MQDGITTSYTYDALGQLIRVVDGQEGATWEYTYDQGGNILSKKKYALGVTSGTVSESKIFTYGNAKWRDQLTAVNGVCITYDKIGNLLNDGTWQYTWKNGRQLASMSKSGENVSFVYNENGLRVQKVATTTGATNYTLYGNNIHHMTQGSNELHFFYDAQNKPAVVVFNGTPYSYVKNQQGDIVAILDSTKNVVVRYAYDAWGRPIMKEGSLATTLGTVQPFRYRGYVYDEETELYYLRSRYCSPIIGRFVNADILTPSIWAITGSNFYAYCSNSPVAFFDPSGYGVDTVLDVISCACGLAELISNPSWEAAGSLLLDVGCAIAPFVPSPRGVKIAGDLLAAGDKVTDAKKTVVVAERSLEYTDKAGDYNRYLEAIETAAQTLPSGSYRVYLSRYADNIPEYVGITKSWPNRSNYWKRRGRTVTTWIPSLDEASAHMVEQAVIDFVGRFEKHQGPLANKINSIGPKGPLAPQYVEFLKKVEELLGQ